MDKSKLERAEEIVAKARAEEAAKRRGLVKWWRGLSRIERKVLGYAIAGAIAVIVLAIAYGARH